MPSAVDLWETRFPVFEAAGLKIRGLKMLRFDDALLREHYAHIAGKPFFPEVQKFMQSTR